MIPYQPSQVVPARGAVLLLLTAIVGGAVIGALGSLLANLFFLILLFPLLMGLMGGVLIAIAVRYGKIRNPLAALVAGLVIGVVIYGSMWAVDYLQFRNSAKSESVARSPAANPAEVEASIDKDLISKTGQPGFLGFMLFKAQAGVLIGRLGNGSISLNLGPVFSWIYWAIELLIILWVAALTGRGPAREPFCEACERWYRLPALLGTLGASRTKEVLGLIESNQFQKLGEELQSNPALPNVGVFLATCGDDCANGDAYLAARQQSRNSKGTVVLKDLSKGLISPLHLQDLRRGIETRKALYGVKSAIQSK